MVKHSPQILAGEDKATTSKVKDRRTVYVERMCVWSFSLGKKKKEKKSMEVNICDETVIYSL